MAIVVAELRQQGIFVIPYIDDLLIVSSSKKECQLHTTVVLRTLEYKVFLVNLRMSRLIPA